MRRLKDYDLVGIGCPVFYYQAPLHVTRFIEELPQLEGKQWFVFCTHGCMMGITLDAMARGLEEKGISVVGYHDTYATATAPFVPSPTLTSGHPDALDYEKARAFGAEIVDRSRRLAAGELPDIPRPLPLPVKWRLRAELFTPMIMKAYLPRLKVDLLKCSLCRTCENTCPVGGIDIGACPPRLQSPCIYCWRCVMVCPEVAINTRNGDWGLLYNELPEIYDQFRPLLERDVTRGRFHWLTDPHDLNFEDTQLNQRRRQLGK